MEAIGETLKCMFIACVLLTLTYTATSCAVVALTWAGKELPPLLNLLAKLSLLSVETLKVKGLSSQVPTLIGVLAFVVGSFLVYAMCVEDSSRIWLPVLYAVSLLFEVLTWVLASRILKTREDEHAFVPT